MGQAAHVGDIINVRFHRFKDGTLDINMNGHHGIIIEVNGDTIKYVLLTSRRYKYANRPYIVELRKSQLNCGRLKAPISLVRVDTVYETTEHPDIIGEVKNEAIVEHIIRCAAYYERKARRKVVASKKKYESTSTKKTLE